MELSLPSSLTSKIPDTAFDKEVVSEGATAAAEKKADEVVVVEVKKDEPVVEVKKEIKAEEKSATDDTNKEAQENKEPEPTNFFAKIKEEYQLEADYEETVEGLNMLLSDVKSSPKIKEEVINDFFESNPEYQFLKDHLEKGYGPESAIDMLTAFDYSKVKLTEEDSDTNKRVYADALSMKGMSKEDIEDVLEAAEAKGEEHLFAKAKSALKDLDTMQRNNITQKAEAEKAQRIADEKIIQDEWKAVKNTIASGKVVDLELSKEEQKKFTDYLMKPVKGGKTQKQIDELSMTLEQQLKADYLMMNKYALVNPAPTKKVETTKKTNLLKDLLDENGKRKLVDMKGGKADDSVPDKEQDIIGAGAMFSNMNFLRHNQPVN